MGEFTPDEPAVVLFAEKAWLQGALLAAVAYGVELILFAMTFYLLLKKISGAKDKKTILFFLVYITVMFILSTLFCASSAQYNQLAFIDDRNFPGGPNQYQLTMFSIPIGELGNVCGVMLTWLCDTLIVWRCQTIYRWSKYPYYSFIKSDIRKTRRLPLLFTKYPLWAIMIFPYLLFLASFVTGLLFLIQMSVASPWKADSAVNWTIPFGSLSLALNIIITGAVVLRLLVYRRRIRSAMGPGHGNHYTSTAAMIVESASIFSIFSLLFLVPFALNNPLNLIFFQALSVVQTVAMLLIVFRVAQGKGWTMDSANPAVSNQTETMPRFAPYSPTPPSPTLGPETGELGSTGLNDRMVYFNGESNDVDINSREAY